MRDARKEIATALIAAINAKLPTKTVYTIVPKAVDNSGNIAPDNYILISDIYQQNDGNKASFIYNYDVLVEVVYNNITSKLNLWADVSSIESIVSNRRDLTLTNDFYLLEISCESTPEEEILTDTGTKTIGIIRFKMAIKDNG